MDTNTSGRVIKKKALYLSLSTDSQDYPNTLQHRRVIKCVLINGAENAGRGKLALPCHPATHLAETSDEK